MQQPYPDVVREQWASALDVPTRRSEDRGHCVKDAHAHTPDRRACRNVSGPRSCSHLFWTRSIYRRCAHNKPPDDGNVMHFPHIAIGPVLN